MRSATQSEEPDDVAEKSNGTDKSKEKNKGRKCKKNRKQKCSVTFTLHNQCNVQKDMVDEDCDRLKVKYKEWQGDEQLKVKLHKSHIEYGHENQILEAQHVPDICILCPSKKYLRDKKDLNCHYNAVHITKLIVIKETFALQCKCSDIRLRGWKKDKCTHNAHYHCTVCHRPRDWPEQLADHMVGKHNIGLAAAGHLNKKKAT